MHAPACGERLRADAACAVRVGVARHWNRSDFPPGQADPPHFELVCSNDACYGGAHVVPRQEGHMADTNDVTTDRKIRKQPDKPGTNPKGRLSGQQYAD